MQAKWRINKKFDIYSIIMLDFHWVGLDLGLEKQI